MQHTFGTVSIDTTPPGREAGPYLFFACASTGVNGELWGTVAERGCAALQATEPSLAEAVLRESGDLVGGDSTARFDAIMSMQPELGFRHQLRYPGRLEQQGSDAVFIDAAQRPLAVHSRSMWRSGFGWVTGAPLGRTRDIACGGTPESPAFYGTESEGRTELSVVAYKLPPTMPAPQASAVEPRPAAAPQRRRAGPR